MEIDLPFLNVPLTLNAWKLWGFCGALMFTGRWFVQLFYSRRAGRPVLPIGYWIMSLLGSFMLLSYFVIYRQDSVGVLSNLFPSFVAGYNLLLELRHRRSHPEPRIP